jgi:hypothetical protein
LIGGADDLKTLIASGEFNKMLASSESQSLNRVVLFPNPTHCICFKKNGKQDDGKSPV